MQPFFVPACARPFGFALDPVSVHTSRTLMLGDLTRVLDASEPNFGPAELADLVVSANVTLKPTATTRRETWKRLRSLYALDPAVPLYRVLRFLWPQFHAEQPLLAALCAVARDPVLRCSAPFLLELTAGEAVTSAQFGEAVSAVYPGRYNATTLRTTGQNVASTWQQSGHLTGHRQKRRAGAAGGPAAMAYALWLARLCGGQGERLLDGAWARLLDVPGGAVRDVAQEAHRRGLLEYRAAGSVVDVGFRQFAVLTGWRPDQ